MFTVTSPNKRSSQLHIEVIGPRTLPNGTSAQEYILKSRTKPSFQVKCQSSCPLPTTPWSQLHWASRKPELRPLLQR